MADSQAPDNSGKKHGTMGVYDRPKNAYGPAPALRIAAIVIAVLVIGYYLVTHFMHH
jgi:hypothetical protein